MVRDPAPQTNAQSGDLVLGRGAARPGRLVWPPDPNADAIFARFGADAQKSKRVDQPSLQSADEGANIGASALQIEHDVSDALPRPVIRELTAAAGPEDGKAGVEKIALLGARARGIEGRVFEEPDALRRLPGGDRLDARLHRRDGFGVIGQARRNHPFEGGRAK